MRIDVVLPTLDPDIERLDRAISSLLEQEDAEPNLIVVDDSDGDAVRTHVEPIESVSYIRGPGTTLADALNEGVEAGDAPLVARQDADDVSAPSRLARQRRRFQREQDLDLLGTGATVVRPSGSESTRRVKEELTLDDFTGGNPILHGSVMFRRAAFEEIGGYDERFQTSEDIELWVRMIDAGMTLRNIDRPLYKLYLHDDSIYADQLRETKLMGRFARMLAQDRTSDAIETRVLDEGDVDAVYELLSADEKSRFHQEMAMELLRYGNRAAARDHARKALAGNRLNVTRLGLLVLSFLPEFVADSAVDVFRVVKNTKIKRSNR